MSDEKKSFQQTVDEYITKRNKIVDIITNNRLTYYQCILCDQKVTQYDISNNWEGDLVDSLNIRDKSLVLCKKCEIKCYYCGQDATSNLFYSLYNDSELVSAYGKVVIFCSRCEPSCSSGKCMGYANEECSTCGCNDDCSCSECSYHGNNAVSTHVTRPVVPEDRVIRDLENVTHLLYKSQ